MVKVVSIPVHERLGLSRSEAAEYIGIGASLFDEMVDLGKMPPPKLIGGRKVWRRVDLEKAFAELPYDGQNQTKADSPWRGAAV